MFFGVKRMKLSKREWGRLNGRTVFLFDIEMGDMRAAVSNYGGILQSLLVKNGRGEAIDTVLGYDTLQEYVESETFFGAMVGPIADRLGQGRCTLDGKEAQFPLNAGPDCMHSASYGFHALVWDWEEMEDGIAFIHNYAEGELPLPGNLQVRLCYRMPCENTLRLEYSAVCSRETALSFTNHSYFTLNGGRGDCGNHVLWVNASHYAETCRDAEPICTGRRLDVSGTPFDLRTGCRVGDVLKCSGFREIQTGGGIDHYFCVDGEGMRCHARLASAEDALEMTCRSDAPGVLVYSANGLEAEKGKNGRLYGRNFALCLETERFPNAVNLPGLRESVILSAGERFESATEFCFSALQNGEKYMGKSVC